jgi:hypothetical protein
MQNVKIETQGTKLVITMDLTAAGEKSKSGKSVVVATTKGNVTVPGTDLKLGLNLYR